MNKHLQKFARKTLKEDLFWCYQEQQMVFKLMYSHLNLDMQINDVVDQIYHTKLSWAMEQVKRTLELNEKQRQNTCL